jgi:IS5 family transposase
LLELTIVAGLETRAVKPTSLKQSTVDTTVQEKAVAFLTDGRLYHQGRVWLVRLASTQGLNCDRVTFAKANNRCSRSSATRRLARCAERGGN